MSASDIGPASAVGALQSRPPSGEETKPTSSSQVVGRAGGVRVEVVRQRQVRAGSRRGRIDGQARDEVVDAAADRVDRDRG